MRTWDTLYPDVMPFIPAGLPEPMVDRQIMRAAQDFCTATRAWRAVLDPVITSAGVLSYDVDLDAPAEVVRLESATLDGHCLEVWRENDHGHGRFVATADGGKTVDLHHAPGDGQKLVLTVTLKPSDSAVGIDADTLVDLYSRTIAMGAIAYLSGDAVAQAFQDACATINTRVWRGTAQTRPRSRASWF